MAEKIACPKCGAPCPAEGHKTIPHLATVKCPKCGEANVAVKPEESDAKKEPEESDAKKAAKRKGKDD